MERTFATRCYIYRLMRIIHSGRNSYGGTRQRQSGVNLDGATSVVLYKRRLAVAASRGVNVSAGNAPRKEAKQWQTST
jgi:hypothetical protein